jgi:glycosyltransferase involved in cell wall biosynthesis
MFVTTVIPTIGRSTLDTAVMSVISQAIPGEKNEIIVVNDSGNPLPPADWAHCQMVRIVETQRHERSVARNTGAAVAKGQYLHFLDDDDWMLPDSFRHFYKLSQGTDAPFMYGGSRLMEDSSTHLYDIHMKDKGNCFAQMMAGEWIPTGSYLVKREVFFKAGGFTPLMNVYEDFDFTRRAAQFVDFDYIQEPVLCILRGADWNTSTPRQPQKKLIRELTLSAREKILSNPMAFPRILKSAKTNYWRGHVLRTYLSSFVWNLKARTYAQAIARSVQIIILMALSGYLMLRPEYWKGLMKPHISRIVSNPAQHQL